MCMFCAALPMVVGATAVAQGEQRKKLAATKAHKQDVFPAKANSLSTDGGSNDSLELGDSITSRRGMMTLSPMRISQLGALAFLGLLIASAFYHTHLPG